MLTSSSPSPIPAPIARPIAKPYRFCCNVFLVEIEFSVESGRGYKPAQWPADKAYQEGGRIYIDAMFSPIRKVMFDIQKTPVAKRIADNVLTLPLYADLSVEDVDRICEIILK